MDTYVPKLRLLDRSEAGTELDLATELFHRINRIIPENQELLTVPPACRVRDAVEELVGMIERGELRLPEMQRRYVWRSPQADCHAA